ncbi:MAG: phage holin family protein [Ornithinibacter sp.]
MLAATIALVPGIRVSSSDSILLAVVMISLVGGLLRPVFVRVALVFGWFGAALLALFSNAAVLGAGLYLTPGIDVSGPF